jgi:hypothetical protein
MNRISATLSAAVVDSGARRLLEHGRLTDAIEPGGFAPLQELVAAGPAVSSPRGRPKANARAEEKRAGQRRHADEARARLRGLRDELREARIRAREGQRSADRLEREALAAGEHAEQAWQEVARIEQEIEDAEKP